MNRSTLRSLRNSIGKGPLLVRFFLLLAVTVEPLVLNVEACVNSTVRDGAFREGRDIHGLCVISNEADPGGQETYRKTSDWFHTFGKDLNVKPRLVTADDPNVNWTECGIPSAPPSVPVTVLAGLHTAERRHFFIDYWEPAPSIENLKHLRDSPMRRRIRQEVVNHLAVFLYVRGTGSSAGEFESIIRQVAADWYGKEKLGISVVTLERSDPEEKLLLSFAGLGETGPDWVATVFGRGKLIPPLQGPEITSENLNSHIQWLLRECTCMRPPSSYGVDIPMDWTAEDEAAVESLRDDMGGFAMAWAGPLPNPSDRSFLHSGTLRNMLYAFGALIVAVGVTTIMILRRGNQWNAGRTAADFD